MVLNTYVALVSRAGLRSAFPSTHFYTNRDTAFCHHHHRRSATYQVSGLAFFALPSKAASTNAHSSGLPPFSRFTGVRPPGRCRHDHGLSGARTRFRRY